jgi:hypothetical protein
MGKEKHICAEVPGFSSPFSLTNQPSVYYLHESLTLHKTPWTYPIPNPQSLAGWTSNRGKDHGGEAYRRQYSSDGVVGDVGEVTAVTSVCGSASEVARAALATSASDEGRRRHLLRPNHGGRVQSKCTRSSTGWCRSYARKESRNGSVVYPVHVLRRGYELRRAWAHCSGGAGPRLKLGKASRPLEEAIRGLRSSGGGRDWFGHGGRPRAALAGRGEVAWAAGWLRKARRGAEGATGKVAVHEGGLYSHSRAWHGRGHGGGRGRACGRALGVFPSACPRRTRGG